VFMRRIDREDRGGAWAQYLRQTSDDTAKTAQRLCARESDESDSGRYVRLTEFDPDGETKVLAAAMYGHSHLSDGALHRLAAKLTPAEREELLKAYVGQRTNRRHRPGRALESTSYRFEIVVDYGAFRDLQRHRMLTLDWQPLSPKLGFDMPQEMIELGGEDDWRRVMQQCDELYGELRDRGLSTIAPYALPMANRVRFYMQMNAREAMHMIELRTSPQGHPAYRWVCQEMWRLIDQEAEHHALAAAMTFADMSHPDQLGRLDSEQRKEQRLAALAP